MSYYAFNDKGLSDNPTTVIDFDIVQSIVTNGNTITCYIYNGNTITLDTSNYPSDFASTLIKTFLEYKNPQESEEEMSEEEMNMEMDRAMEDLKALRNSSSLHQKDTSMNYNSEYNKEVEKELQEYYNTSFITKIKRYFKKLFKGE